MSENTEDVAVLRLVAETGDFSRQMRAARTSLTSDLKGMTEGARRSFEQMMDMMDQVQAENARMASALGMIGTQNSAAMRKLSKEAAHSLGQTTQAMRMLPAQLSDVATQLAGGQNPLLVLMQQGLQTRDMFGSFGGMFRGLASVITPTSVALGGAAAAVGTLAFAYVQGSAEGDRMARSLHLTRNAAGLTIDTFRTLGEQVEAASGATIGMSREAAEAAVGMGLTGRATTEVAKAIAAYAKAADTTTDKASALFGGIGKDALKWSVEMTDKTNFLTLATYAQIKALQDQGRNQEAAAVAAKSLADRLGEFPPQLGTIETLLQSGEKAWSKFWDAAKGAGRPKTTQDQLDAVAKALASARAGGWFDLRSAGQKQEQVSGLMDQQAALQEKLRFEQRTAGLAAVSAAEEKARISAAQYRDTMISSLDPMRERSKRLAELERNVATLAGTELAWSAAEVARARQQIMIQTQDQTAAAEAQARADQRLAGVQADIARELRLVEDRNAAIAALRSQDMISARQAAEEERQLAAESAQLRVRSLQAQYDALKSRPADITPGGATRRATELLNLEGQIADAAAAAQRAWISGTARVGQIDLAAAQDDMQQWAAMYTRLLTETQSLSDQIGMAQAGAITNPVEAARAEADASIAKIRRDTRKVAAEVRLLIDMMRGRGQDKQADALERQLDAYQTEALRRETAERMKAEGEIARKAMDEWQKTADKIGDTLTDALMRGFEGGKDGAQNLKDTVVNMFKTMVLRPAIQSMVAPLASSLTNSIAGSLGQSIGGSFMGSAGGSALGQMAGAGVGLWGGSAMYGAALGTTSIGAGSQAAMLASQTGIFGAEGAAMTAAAAGNAGTASIMSSLGTAMPYLAAAAAIYAIAKSLDKSGTMHSGFASTYSASQGLGELSGPTAVAGYANTAGFDRRADVAPLTNAIAQSVGQMLDATAMTFGQRAGYAVATAFADDSSKDGAWGQLRIALGDSIVSDWSQNPASRWAPKTFADGQKGQDQYIAAVAKDVRAALNAIGLPTWASKMLDQLGEGATIEQLGATVQRINEIKGALQALGDVLPSLAGLTDDAKMAIINAAGGIQALAASVQTYEQRILTDAQRAALQSQRVADAFKRLGITMPNSKSAFKSLVDSIDTSTDNGRTLLTGVLALAGSFADVQDAAGGATSSVSELAQSLETEINRIRGLMGGNAAGGAAQLAALQAEFAMTTAQARAGDSQAYRDLPEISRALLDAGAQQATSRLDLVRLQAQTLRSLQDTKALLGVAGLTATAALDPASSAAATAAAGAALPSVSGAAGGDLLAEMRALRAEVIELRSTVSAGDADNRTGLAQLASHEAKIVRILERVTPDGDALATREVAP